MRPLLDWAIHRPWSRNLHAPTCEQVERWDDRFRHWRIRDLAEVEASLDAKTHREATASAKQILDGIGANRIKIIEHGTKPPKTEAPS